jgi:hypothetical protein
MCVCVGGGCPRFGLEASVETKFIAPARNKLLLFTLYLVTSGTSAVLDWCFHIFSVSVQSKICTSPKPYTKELNLVGCHSP